MENNGTFNKTKIPSLKTSKKKKNSSKIDNFFKHEEEYRRESQLQKQQSDMSVINNYAPLTMTFLNTNFGEDLITCQVWCR